MFNEDVFRVWCIHGFVLMDARRARVDEKHVWIGDLIFKQLHGRISKKRDLMCKVKI